MKNEKIIINIYPRENSWKNRLVVIFSSLFGLPYHHTITKENFRESMEESDREFYRSSEVKK